MSYHRIALRLRHVLWTWIIVATVPLLLHAPVKVTERFKTKPATEIKWIGPFGEVDNIHYSRSSMDLSRLLIAFLLINGLPILGLWKLPEKELGNL
jgi:hypothetical protein